MISLCVLPQVGIIVVVEVSVIILNFLVSSIFIVLAFYFYYVMQFVDFEKPGHVKVVDIELQQHMGTGSMTREPEVLETEDESEE